MHPAIGMRVIPKLKAEVIRAEGRLAMEMPAIIPFIAGFGEARKTIVSGMIHGRLIDLIGIVKRHRFLRKPLLQLGNQRLLS